MPFKTMTHREQREAKRELRRLRELERDLRHGYGGTDIARGEICEGAAGAIRAAETLGYVVVVRSVRSSTRTFIAAAYRLGA
jgi:hypothetical protein